MKMPTEFSFESYTFPKRKSSEHHLTDNNTETEPFSSEER